MQAMARDVPVFQAMIESRRRGPRKPAPQTRRSDKKSAHACALLCLYIRFEFFFSLSTMLAALRVCGSSLARTRAIPSLSLRSSSILPALLSSRAMSTSMHPSLQPVSTKREICISIIMQWLCCSVSVLLMSLPPS